MRIMPVRPYGFQHLVVNLNGIPYPDVARIHLTIQSRPVSRIEIAYKLVTLFDRKIVCHYAPVLTVGVAVNVVLLVVPLKLDVVALLVVVLAVLVLLLLLVLVLVLVLVLPLLVVKVYGVVYV